MRGGGVIGRASVQRRILGDDMLIVFKLQYCIIYTLRGRILPFVLPVWRLIDWLTVRPRTFAKLRPLYVKYPGPYNHSGGGDSNTKC